MTSMQISRQELIKNYISFGERQIRIKLSRLKLWLQANFTQTNSKKAGIVRKYLQVSIGHSVSAKLLRDSLVSSNRRADYGSKTNAISRAELLHKTLEVWQPCYPAALYSSDGEEILSRWSSLISVLGRSVAHTKAAYG